MKDLLNDDDIYRWYVITLPSLNREKRIAKHLQNTCRTLHIPLTAVRLYIPRVRRASDNGVEEEDLYPGYGFLSLVSSIPPRLFFWTFDSYAQSLLVLKRVIAVNKHATTKVPAEVSHSLVMEAQVACSDSKERHGETFQPKDDVRICRGAFTGFEGTVLGANPDEVFVQIHLLGTEVTIRTDYEDLEHIAEENGNGEAERKRRSRSATEILSTG